MKTLILVLNWIKGVFGDVITKALSDWRRDEELIDKGRLERDAELAKSNQKQAETNAQIINQHRDHAATAERLHNGEF